MIARVLTVVLLLAALPAAAAQTIDGGELGSVRLFEPEGEPDGIVFLFSDAAGWDQALARAGEALAGAGATVAGVDLPAYLKGLAANEGDVHHAVPPHQRLNHRPHP